MRKLLLLFIIALFFASIANAQNSYRIVVYPGPGNTTIAFTDTSNYEIQYDSRYNVILPNITVVYELNVHNNVNDTLNNYVLKIDLNQIGFVDWDIDPSTIYFVDEYGNALYYWIEEYDAGTGNGIVYVKIPFIEANSNITIYMFCGGDNPYSSYNDPYNVFPLYDDFEGTELDPDTWTTTVVGDGSHSVSNSILTITDASAVKDKYIVYSKQTFSPPLEAVAKLKSDPTDVGRYMVFGLCKNVSYTSTESIYLEITKSTGYYDITWFYWFGGSSSGVRTYTEGTIEWSKVKIILTSDRGAFYRDDDDLLKEMTDPDYIASAPLHLEMGIRAGSTKASTGSGYWDYVYVRTFVEPEPSITATRLGGIYSNANIDNSNGLYAIMGSRFKSWFGLGDGSSYPVRIVYDSGFTFWINSEQVGGGDIGYDNDYFLYRIKYLPSEGWSFYIDDFYTGQYLSKTTGDTSVFSFNETYITKPYLFYIVFAPYRSDYVIIHIRAPPNYYVDNVTVQYMYAYYQNDNVYIWFEGNDAYIKLGYTNNYNAYYPLIVQFDLGVGDLPDRNTYDASRDPYSDNPPPTGSGSSGNNGNGGGGSFWGYQVPSSSFNGTLDIPGSSLFPQFLLNAMLFAAIFLPSVFLYKRYWLFPVLVGLLVLARIGYMFFYVPIVLFTIFVVTMFLREYIAEEYSLLVGLIMGYFMNVFIISGNQEYAPEPPSNPFDIPSYLNDLLTKAITFSYLPSPFNTIMTIFFVSLVVFATIRLVVRIVRGV